MGFRQLDGSFDVRPRCWQAAAFHRDSGEPAARTPELASEIPAVIVTTNYRLNVFGFLTLPASSDSSERARGSSRASLPGNYGLLDQQAAHSPGARIQVKIFTDKAGFKSAPRPHVPLAATPRPGESSVACWQGSHRNVAGRAVPALARVAARPGATVGHGLAARACTPARRAHPRSARSLGYR
jgi:hypothetical protein